MWCTVTAFSPGLNTGPRDGTGRDRATTNFHILTGWDRTTGFHISTGRDGTRKGEKCFDGTGSCPQKTTGRNGTGLWRLRFARDGTGPGPALTKTIGRDGTESDPIPSFKKALIFPIDCALRVWVGKAVLQHATALYAGMVTKVENFQCRAIHYKEWY